MVYNPLSFWLFVNAIKVSVPFVTLDFSFIVIGVSTPTTFTLNLYVSSFVCFVVVVSFFIGNI